MAISIIVLTPESTADATLAIAAVHAGEAGLLDLGLGRPAIEVRAAVDRLARHAGDSDRWGVRWNAWGRRIVANAFLDVVCSGKRLPILLVAGRETNSPGRLLELLSWARVRAERVLFEAYDLDQARAAAVAGFDGLVLKGNEAGGRVSQTSTFLLLQSLQSLREGLDLPVWLQGAWGPDTAAIVPLGGAAGIVLAEELWLAQESPWSTAERARLAPLDGSETVCLDDGERAVRLSRQVDREGLTRLEESLGRGDAWHAELRERWSKVGADDPVPLPLGQGIAFASRLARRYETVGQILGAYREAAGRHLEAAANGEALRAEGPLAEIHGTRYPIVQGPLTRVSDRAPFMRAVAENGALPFLALALMRKDEARRLLLETRDTLGEMPWGVGLLGFVPPELRDEQLQAVREVRPRFGIITGGAPAQAQELEREGISTYLQVTSPGLLETFLEQGTRKFILEGREYGGQAGPRSSLALWQSAIDVLVDAGLKDAAAFQLLFAGGMHDALSAAMVQTLAVPLVDLGMKIGVLVGTAYLFTAETVASGAITQTYQDEAISCSGSTLLDSGVAHAWRNDGARPMAEIHDELSSGSGVFLSLFAEAQRLGDQEQVARPNRSRLEPSSELLRLHGESMQQWLELQREQARLNERFLRLHERLLAANLGWAQEPVVSPADRLNLSRVPVAAGTPSMTVGPQGASPDEVADGPPNVETFFGDLLTAVSQRTAHPVDRLDPDLPLESGLGIDSTKVLEIFNVLKPYHQILADPDQYDEELLAQFVDLKTLGAIREHYARRRTEILESAGEIPVAQFVGEGQQTPLAATTESKQPIDIPREE